VRELRFARNARGLSLADRKLCFRSVRELRFARNAPGLGPRAPGVVGGRRQPCGAAMLRVAAAHQFASA